MAKENNQEELIDLVILNATDLPERIRNEKEIYGGFVEDRFEKHSPVEPRIIPFDGSPALRMREAFEKEDLLDLNFDEE